MSLSDLQDFFNTSSLKAIESCVKQGNCVAFVGSGLSSSVYGTGWNELVEKLCRECAVPSAPPISSILDKAERARQLTGRAGQAKRSNADAYYKVLKECYGYPSHNSRRGYQFIAELPFCGCITINYDDLLAQQFRPPKRLYVIPEISATELRTGSLFHIHGIVRSDGTEIDRDNIVLSDDEFDLHYNPDRTLRPFLHSAFTFKDILFLGCSIDEAPIQTLLEVSYKCQQDIQRCREVRRMPMRFILLPEEFKKIEESNQEPRLSRDTHQEQIQDACYSKYKVQVVRYPLLRGPDKYTAIDELLRRWSGTDSLLEISSCMP